MGRFVQYITKIIGLFALLLIGWHLVFLVLWDAMNVFEERTWYWGDSQHVQGILHEDLGLGGVFSMARHGNGYYDLQSFASRIPHDTPVIVGYGPLFYRVRLDRSQGGLLLKPLSALIRGAYQFGLDLPIVETIRANVQYEFSEDAWTSSVSRSFPDTVNYEKRSAYLEETTALIKDANMHAIYSFKTPQFFESIREIEEKSTKLIILSLPLCDELEHSTFASVQSHFDSTLLALESDKGYSLDTINIQVDFDPFYDATHLNEGGQAAVTEALREAIPTATHKSILILSFIRSSN